MNLNEKIVIKTQTLSFKDEELNLMTFDEYFEFLKENKTKHSYNSMIRINENVMNRIDFDDEQKKLLTSLVSSSSQIAVLCHNPEFKRAGDALKISFDEIFLDKDSGFRKLIEENFDNEDFKEALRKKGEEEGVHFLGKFVSLNTIVNRLLKKGMSETIRIAKRKSDFKLGAENGSVFILKDLIRDYKIRKYSSISRNFDRDEIKRINKILEHEEKSKVLFETLAIPQKEENDFINFASKIASGKSIDCTENFYLSSKAIALVKYKNWIEDKQPQDKNEIILETIRLNRGEIGNVQNLLKRITNEQQLKIDKVLEEIEFIDDKLFNQSWSNEEILVKISEIQKKVRKESPFNVEEKHILKTINDSEMAVKHKLKLVIPLFYKFLRYEGELEFSNKQKLPETLKELKNILFEVQ